MKPAYKAVDIDKDGHLDLDAARHSLALQKGPFLHVLEGEAEPSRMLKYAPFGFSRKPVTAFRPG